MKIFTKKYVLLIIISFLISFNIKAQTTIKGTVTDLETDQPLAGTAVNVPDTETGTMTDENGSFQLTVPEGTNTLKVSMLGYITKEVKISDPSAPQNIQLEASILMMNEVVVEAFNSDKKLLQSTSSVGVLTEKDFKRNNQVFLQNSLNTISGVRMNVRSGMSQSNILIRGMGTYSRFNNRGIKVYLNGIPLSDADGTTSLDDVDYTMLGRAEVIKGPASSIYGATLGGVVLFQTQKAPYGTKSINQSVMVGSYGLVRTNTGIMLGTNKTNLLINYGHQEFQGYRKHSSSYKDFVNVVGDFHLNSKQTINVLFNYTKIDDKYAGELDSAHISQDPTQAFPMYVIKNVGLNQTQTRLGVGHTYHFTSNFSNTTSVFTGSINNETPIEPYFGTSNRNKYGARSVFSYTPSIGKIKTRFHLGSEFIYNDNLNKRYFSDFATGAVGGITYDTEVKADQLNIFAQAEADITSKTTVTIGTSYNLVHYQLIDRQKAGGVDYSGSVDFTPVFTPRVAAVHTFNSNLAVFGNISTGFSPPTSDQISLVSGAINRNLKAENDISYEVGSRGNFFKNKLSYNASIFTMSIRNLLIQQVQAGFTSYTNAGKSSNTGLELNASYSIINDSIGLFRLLRPFAAYTYNNFVYKDYKSGSFDYSGNKAVGISPNVVNAGLDVQFALGFYLNGTYYFYDKMPIVDNNSINYKTVNLFNVRGGIRGILFRHFQYDLYAGIENIANVHYSASIALNTTPKPPFEPTSRFFNPALPRNYYTGLSLRYLF